MRDCTLVHLDLPCLEMISGGLSRVLVGSERIPTVSLHFRQYQAFYSLTQAFPVRFSSQFTLNRPGPLWFVLFHGGFSWFGHGGWTSQFCDPQRVNKPVSWRIFLKEKGGKTAIIGQFLLSTSKKNGGKCVLGIFLGTKLGIDD